MTPITRSHIANYKNTLIASLHLVNTLLKQPSHLVNIWSTFQLHTTSHLNSRVRKLPNNHAIYRMHQYTPPPPSLGIGLVSACCQCLFVVIFLTQTLTLNLTLTLKIWRGIRIDIAMERYGETPSLITARQTVYDVSGLGSDEWCINRIRGALCWKPTNTCLGAKIKISARNTWMNYDSDAERIFRELYIMYGGWFYPHFHLIT